MNDDETVILLAVYIYSNPKANFEVLEVLPFSVTLNNKCKIKFSNSVKLQLHATIEADVGAACDCVGCLCVDVYLCAWEKAVRRYQEEHSDQITHPH